MLHRLKKYGTSWNLYIYTGMQDLYFLIIGTISLTNFHKRFEAFPVKNLFSVRIIEGLGIGPKNLLVVISVAEWGRT